jgi:sterol desaturase/sphingolipid hydroxylase (fatty acid hydroxylase superfamily)
MFNFGEDSSSIPWLHFMSLLSVHNVRGNMVEKIEVEKKTALENIVLTRVLHLNAMIQGIVVGLVLGSVIFFATNWLILKGGDRVGPHLSLLGQFFIGYRVTFAGSLIGFAYGFVVGFVGGYAVAKLYNWFARRREHYPTAAAT